MYAYFILSFYNFDFNPDGNSYGNNYNEGSRIQSFNITITNPDGTNYLSKTGISDFCQTIPYDSTISITNIVYRTGYQYNNYSLTSSNQVISSTNNNITFKFINAGDSSLSWNTKPIKYNFSVTSQNTKYGTVSGPSGNIDYNSSVTISATPVTNYIFSGWIDESGKTVSTSATYTFNIPANDYSLKATFTFDITKITSIKVLNVYPYTEQATTFQSWMNSYGQGKISVTPVYIDEFNNNPSNYLGSSNNWNYDVVVFGFRDCNNQKDLSSESSDLTQTFISENNGVIFGHDTITAQGCGTRSNFNKLAPYVNLSLGSRTYNASTKIKINKEGIFTSYPYTIGNVGTILTIPATHVYGQTANGDIWLQIEGDSVSDNRNFYLTTYKNSAMIQTGHSNGSATNDEQKILANLIFYMYSYSKMNDI